MTSTSPGTQGETAGAAAPTRREHPAAFPLALAARMDRRNFLGVDSSPMYAAMARQRVNSFLL